VVKECCAGIVQVAFLTAPVNAGQNIVQIVDRQLGSYHYIYPTSVHVSSLFSAGCGVA
jgi:hypothetical protein